MKPAMPRGKAISTIAVSAPMMTDSHIGSEKPRNASRRPVTTVAPIAAPQIDINPPMITAVIRLRLKAKPNTVGSIARRKWTNRLPETLAMPAATTNIWTLCLTMSMPTEPAAISLTAIAFNARPTQERSTLSPMPTNSSTTAHTRK